jgi:hypothetical protein
VASQAAAGPVNGVLAMQMIYNSPNYSVFVLASENGQLAGYEILDKAFRREAFLRGELALHFRSRVEALAVDSPDFEAIDALIGEYGGLIQQPVLMH